MQSVMVHQFSQVPRADIPRSSFNRSHGYKTTFDAGLLIPFYADEALPGDTFNLRANIFARLATPIAPIMDNMFMDTHYFAVPVRLIWDNWQRFNGEQDDPGDSTDFLIPQVVAPAVTGFTPQSLSDYLGLPTGVPGISVSSLWHRGYNLIYNSWYRDQNLQDSLVVDKGDGPDTLSNYTLRRRGKRHDYFTSALPWPQKGPGVEISMGSSAPVYGNGKSMGFTDGTNTFGLNLTRKTGTVNFTNVPNYATTGFNTNIGTSVTANNFTGAASDTGKTIGVVATGESGLFADLSQADAVTINSLRQAFQIQKLLERDARGGSRYIELVQSHFGVTSPDLRATRPIFLGSSTARVVINPVQQTSATDETSPQGNLAAFGLVADAGKGFVHSFTEHCIILGLVSVRADLTYQQGIPRMFSRLTRFDYYWPALAHLGEQAILNKEIYATGTPATDEAVWGYQERWAEYRYYPSQITGKLRSNDPQSLDVWHLSQEFTEAPALNTDFIQENPPVDRVIAVPSEPHFIFDSFIDLKCARPMPVYSVPGLIDHF